MLRPLNFSLLDDLGDAVLMIDAEDRISYLGPRAEALLGLPAGDCLGRRVCDHVRLGDEPLPLDEVRRFLEGGATSWRGEGTLGARDGLTAEWTLRPLDPEASGGELVLVVRPRPPGVPGRGEQARQPWADFYRAVSEVITLPPEADFFAACARSMRELSGARFVSTNEVCGDRLVCRGYASAPSLVLSAAQLLGVEPVGLELPLLEAARVSLATGRLHEVPGGLHAILLDRWPEWLCRLIARSADLGSIYSIGLCWRGQLLGNATLATQRGQQVQAERIEALANLIALAFQKRQTEAALRRSEGRYRTLFHSSALAIGVRAIDGAYIEFNQAYARMLGYTLEELRARRTVDVTHPDDVQLSEQHLGRIARGESELERYEKRYLRKDGSVVRGDVCVQPLRGEDGAPAAILGTVVDVTQRWQAQRESVEWKRRYELLALSSGSVAYELHEDGTVVWGGSLGPALGYRAEELEGGLARWMELIHPEDRVEAEAAHLAAVRTQVRLRVEYRLRHRDGRYLRVQDTGYPVRGTGELARVVGLLVDVTAERKAEEERRALEEQLRQAQKLESIGRLAGGVAHDFNNLMTAILGCTELLLGQHRAGDPDHDDLLDIRDAARRAAALTSQLLAFSRKQIIIPRVIELGGLLRASERVLQRLIGEDVALVFELAPDLASIKADPGQIEQVLFNLVVNARDAMPGGGKLTVAAENVTVDETRAAQADATSGHHVRLSVTDSGQGMTPEVRERIFEPFFTTKELGKGTGLGLSTVFGIIKQNGGFIEVESAPGQGATFRLYWPRAEGQATPSVEQMGCPRPGTETVLVVEDEEVVRSTARRFLTHHGYRVLCASNPSEAEVALRGADPRVDILLTDVILPELDGRQLFERLRVLQPELRVVFMSGHAGDVIAARGVLEQDVHFLQKPFDVAQLTRALRAALEEER